MLTIMEQKIRIKKYLRLILDHKLQFHEHREYIKKKIAKRIGAMYKSKNLLPLKYRKMFANSLMLPQFDYLDLIWCRAGKTKLKELDILYNKKTAKKCSRLWYKRKLDKSLLWHEMVAFSPTPTTRVFHSPPPPPPWKICAPLGKVCLWDRKNNIF